MPPRTTRHCDGPRVPDRSVVGTCLRRLKTPGSHRQIASNSRRTTTVSKTETTCHRLRENHPAERRRGLGCQGQRHRGWERYTLDIPLHRRDLWGVLYCSRIRVSQIPPLGPCGPSVGMTSGPVQRSENRIGPQQNFFRPWSGRLSQSSSLLASWRRRRFMAYIRSSASARVLEISDAAAQEETPQLTCSGSG